MPAKAVTFTGPDLALVPGEDDEMMVDDGDRIVPVKPKPEPISRPPEIPPFGVMRLIQDGAVVSSLHLGEQEPAAIPAKVGEWIAGQGAPERLEVEINAPSVTDEGLGPLLVIGHHHRIPIDVHLRPRG